jgi:hypothetical protein
LLVKIILEQFYCSKLVSIGMLVDFQFCDFETYYYLSYERSLCFKGISSHFNGRKMCSGGKVTLSCQLKLIAKLFIVLT